MDSIIPEVDSSLSKAAFRPQVSCCFIIEWLAQMKGPVLGEQPHGSNGPIITRTTLKQEPRPRVRES